MEYFGSTEAFIYHIICQMFGIIGITASIISFQCRKHKNVMIFRSLNEGFFGLQYIMLGAYTGAVMNFFGIIRNFIFAKQVEKKKSTLPMQITFSVIFIAFALFTWDGPKSILVGVAKATSTFAYGMKKLRIMRILVLFTCTSWLIYNLFVGSYAGAVCEIFTLCSIIVAFFRMDIIPYFKNKKKEQ